MKLYALIFGLAGVVSFQAAWSLEPSERASGSIEVSTIGAAVVTTMAPDSQGVLPRMDATKICTHFAYSLPELAPGETVTFARNSDNTVSVEALAATPTRQAAIASSVRFIQVCE